MNYTKNLNRLQLKMNFDVDVLIPQDDSVRLLRNIVEEMDFSKVYSAYSEKGRKPAVSPVTMFQIIVYAYMNRIYSCRDIERSCRRDVNFMWLLDGQPAPDHATISRFRDSRLVGLMEDLFYQFVHLLHESGELHYRNVFIDGTKIEAYANRYTFVWKKSVEKNKAKLLEKIDLLFESYQDVIGSLDEVRNYISTLKKIKRELSRRIKEQNIIFVKGIGKRKTPLQREYETVEEYLGRLENYDASLEKMENRNSYSKTDHDATFMRMKEDHMMNGQLKPAYNIQLASEGGYVVGVLLSHERSDVKTLIPFLDRIHGHLPRKFSSVVADSGYEGEENYAYLKSEGITPYIKPSNHEIRKTRKYREDIGRRENMTYLPEEDVFLCANNQKLFFAGFKKSKTSSGYVVQKRRYSCDRCGECPIKEKCLKRASSKSLEFSLAFEELRKESAENIHGPDGIRLRMNRSIQAEGVFAYLKEDLRYRRFRHRGKKNVENDMLLVAFAINVNKLHNKIQDEKLGYLEYKTA